jgi:putative endonuclease
MPFGRFEGQSYISSMHYCYILRCADGSFYVGVAEDPERRCREHNQGKGALWTAGRLPVEIVWTESHDSLSSARKREVQLKGWSRNKKAALIGGSLRLRSGQA